ncbi:unnamed protein product [Pieris brassicae]|uniref:Uncharacterized protein n=1 Tax=Pieris brassicae TaxID=7116 RepID=A0A9P0TG85_PIEBR|nr:unnamed protein product [Pieris brassicae]
MACVITDTVEAAAFIASGVQANRWLLHERKINSSFWCVDGAGGGEAAARRPRAEAVALRAPAPALRSAARRVLSPRARAWPRRPQPEPPPPATNPERIVIFRQRGALEWRLRLHKDVPTNE